MFSKLFKKKKNNIETSQDLFSLAEMEQDGKKFLLRFKQSQHGKAESGKYPYQMGIATSLSSHSEGMPSKAENEQLINMEEILLHELEKTNIAVFVGAITGGGMKEFIFYTGKPNEASKIFEKLKGEVKHHDLQLSIKDDPYWETYRTYSPRM